MGSLRHHQSTKKCAARPRRKLQIEALESRCVLTAPPWGATPEDLGDFLLGDVHVNVVFLESDGRIDPSTENWTAQQIAEVKQKVVEGVTWWKDLLEAQNSVHELNFHFDFEYADNPFPTAYEPISRVSQDFRLWVGEFLDHVGFGDLEGDLGISKGILAYNHAQRLKSGSDWAFTIFVVNSANDVDDRFAVGSDFSQAFAFAGGRFLISPSGRPASTYAHEMGHMFYALDEHGSASYTARRGYYNTQNLNARSGHPDPDSRVVSIMDSHEAAFPIYAISQSAAEMVGWRDSDGDGIFDVLDVPLSLVGAGGIDPSTGLYRFVGRAEVGVLPNQNQSSHRSDITINQVSRIQYRIDGGAWIDAVEPHAYQVDLDFSFPVPPGSHLIEIRAIDDATNEPGETGVISNIFQGTTTAPSAVTQPGINGFLFEDLDGDGVRDLNEGPLAGWTVEVRGPNGERLNWVQRIDLSQVGDEQDVNHADPGVILTAGPLNALTNFSFPTPVRARTSAVTGAKVFAHQPTGTNTWTTEWRGTQQALAMEFVDPVTTISIDVVANNDNDYGRLEIYDANRQLIERVTTGPLARGEVATLTLGRPQADIKYAVVMDHAGTGVELTNLRFGPSTTTVTDALGAWTVPYLDQGDFTVQVTPRAGWTVTTPDGATQSVTLASGATVENVTFGLQRIESPWQNKVNPLDVDGDGLVAIGDLLKIVQYLRDHGAGVIEGEPEPGDAKIDVDGDLVAGPADMLAVVTALRAQIQQQAAGEGETTVDWQAPSTLTLSINASSLPESELTPEAMYYAPFVTHTWLTSEAAEKPQGPSLPERSHAAPIPQFIPAQRDVHARVNAVLAKLRWSKIVDETLEAAIEDIAMGRASQDLA